MAYYISFLKTLSFRLNKVKNINVSKYFHSMAFAKEKRKIA